MTIGILFVVASLQLVTCVPINTTAAVSPMEQQEQQNVACLLRDNAEKRSEFYTSVRAKHGFQDIPGELYSIVTCPIVELSKYHLILRLSVLLIVFLSIVRSFRPKAFQSDSVRCFSQRQCPESEITWCFNLYHPSKCIEVCWDSRSNIINMTENSLPLELNSVFSVTNVSS